MKSFFSVPAIVLGLPLMFAGPILHAQYDNGSVVGTIRDTSGAGVAGATVTITNVATSIAAVAKTNGSGDYEVPTLKVGVYKITASAASFSDAVAENVTVSVGGRQRIDLTVKAGGTATTVEVSDVALQIETETSERGQTITNYQSEALPLVTRNYSDLLGLIPGSRQFSTPIEGLKIEFRTEAYNLFNHTNYYLPNTIGGTQGSNASSGGQISSRFTPRVLQFGLKIL